MVSCLLICKVAFLHDPLTIMSVIDASVVKFEEVSLRVFLDEKVRFESLLRLL